MHPRVVFLGLLEIHIKKKDLLPRGDVVMDTGFSKNLKLDI